MRGMNWEQVFVGILVGAILGIVGSFLRYESRIAVLEDRLQRASKIEDVQPTTEHERAILTNFAEPHRLLELIAIEQKNNIKESFGTLAHQCFTNEDLETFKENKVADRIMNRLGKDKEFLSIVMAVKAMNPADRQDLLDSAIRPLRPTWREIGEVSNKGQTEAGQAAEILIAERIVMAVRQLIKKPNEELNALYVK